MEDDGVYVPPAGEYVRPKGSVHLKPVGGVDNHYVRAASLYGKALRGRREGQRVDFELVPEPGNPWDSWAVALHLDGLRAGYIAARDSGRWQDVVVAYNRRGQAVYASGIITGDDDYPAATVLLPSFDDNEALMEELGLFEECRRVVDALPEEARGRILENGKWLDGRDIRLIRAQAHLAPSLNWEAGNGSRMDDRYPTALYRYLIRRDRDERQARAAARAEEAAKRKAEKEAEKQRRSQEREEIRAAFTAEAVRLFLAGQSRAAIARRLGCSASTVSQALAGAGHGSDDPRKYGADARDERLEKARQALELQRAGLLRREIAARLGCVPETVKILLRDAKFYEDPTTSPDRLAMLQRARGMQDVPRDKLAAELGVSVAAVKELRRDLGVLDELHPGLMGAGAGI